MREARSSYRLGSTGAWGCRAALLLCALALPALASAQSLLENSPFLPPDFEAPGGAAPETPAVTSGAPTNLELRGIYQIAGVNRFNIYDRGSQRGVWVGENDDASAYRVLAYDPNLRSVNVQVGGRTLSLTLSSPTDSPMAVSAASAPARPQVGPPEPETRRRVVVPPRRVIRPTRNNSGEPNQAPPSRPVRPAPEQNSGQSNR